MAAYLMCVTVSGGVPIFNRKFGDIKSVSETYKQGGALGSWQWGWDVDERKKIAFGFDIIQIQCCINTFSNFSCMLLNPYDFFQFEF